MTPLPTDPQNVIGLSWLYGIAFVRDKDGNEVDHPFKGPATWHDYCYGDDRGKSCPLTLGEVDDIFRRMMEYRVFELEKDREIGTCIFTDEQIEDFRSEIDRFYFVAHMFGLIYWEGNK